MMSTSVDGLSVQRDAPSDETSTVETGPSEDLLYSEVEEELRATVRRYLEDTSPWLDVLARVDRAAEETVTNAEVWRGLAADLGLAGLIVPEEYGGAGAGLREAAVVLEEIGRAVAPVPFLTSAVVATSILLASPPGQERDDALRRLAAGEVTAAFVSPLAQSPQGTGPTEVRARAVDGTARLDGAVTGVAEAGTADLLLVLTEDGLYVVEADAHGVTRDALRSLDPTRPLATVTFADAPARQVAAGAQAAAAVRHGRTCGTGLLASEQVGVSAWCLETTIEYLRTRYQFGRQIGSYQGLKHRLADLWVDITQARAVARYAAHCVATGDDDTPVAVSLAQAACGPTAVKAAEECVQMHGGIGFTWEHPAHLYLKRAKADSVAFGTAAQHRQEIARLVDLPAPGGASAR